MVKVTHPRNRGCIKDKKSRLGPGQPLCTNVNEFGILQAEWPIYVIHSVDNTKLLCLLWIRGLTFLV